MKPVLDNLLVKFVNETGQDEDRLIVIAATHKETTRAVVIETGEGLYNNTGLIPLPVKPGAVILVNKKRGQDIMLDNISYKLIKYSDVLLVLQD